MIVYNVDGTVIELEEPALNSGGAEGAIYRIKGYDRVAKIYHTPEEAKKREDKIRSMLKISQTIQFQQQDVKRHITWPLAPLFDYQQNFIGYGMKLVNSKVELEDVYRYPAPKGTGFSILQRLEYLISLCEGVEAIHKLGQVVGDFNPDNIKVMSNGELCFVDSDSYGVNYQGKIHPCVVCAPGFLAPETLRICRNPDGTSKDYVDVPNAFTMNSDNFGLAIHCFSMLMNGYHPFTCKQVDLTKSLIAPSQNERIRKCETPFFCSVADYTVPDYAPEVDSLPPYIVDLFKRAFVEGDSNPQARAKATEWKRALIRFKGELKSCSNPLHQYWNGNGSCPYCEADKRYKKAANTGVAKLKAAQNVKPWAAPTTSVAPTPTTTPIYNNTAASSGAATKKTKVKKKASSTFWGVTMVLGVILMLVLREGLFYPFYMNLFSASTGIAATGSIGSAIFGLGGMIYYNTYWVKNPDPVTGKHTFMDYIYAFVAGFGIAFTFILVILGLLLLGKVIGGIIKIALGITILMAVISSFN